MSSFLSPAWLAQLTTLAGGDQVGPDAIVVQHRITGGPDGEIAFVIEIEGSRLRTRLGTDPNAVATLTESYTTALALHRGEITPREAFLGGLIRMSGDMRRTIEAASGLSALDPVLTLLRARRVDA